jgi:hypothetical protein
MQQHMARKPKFVFQKNYRIDFRALWNGRIRGFSGRQLIHVPLRSQMGNETSRVCYHAGINTFGNCLSDPVSVPRRGDEIINHFGG